LSFVTAAINAAAAADPNAPDLSPAPKTLVTPQKRRSPRRIIPTNISPISQSVASGRVATRPDSSSLFGEFLPFLMSETNNLTCRSASPFAG
jgi:hypothetical protein